MSKVKQIGVELEGAWNRQPRGSDLEAHADGSIHINSMCSNGSGCEGTDCIHYIGEVVSKPKDSLTEILEWTKKHYPLKSNRTCGMHIHISVENRGDYMRLMSKTFWNYFLKRVTEWGVEKHINDGTIFWERLTGQNKFCLKKFNPEEQVKYNTKAGEVRYTHLNYAYGVHQTIECRLFPTFQKPELSLSAIELYHNIIESYLARPSKEKTIELVIKDDDELGFTRGVKTICV